MWSVLVSSMEVEHYWIIIEHANVDKVDEIEHGNIIWFIIKEKLKL